MSSALDPITLAHRETGAIRLTIGDLRDLAEGHTGSGGPNLRLAVGQDRNNRGGDNLGTHNLAIARVVGGSSTLHQDDLDRLALGSPGAIVQVVEVSRGALVPNSATTQSQRTIATGGKPSSVDGTCLSRGVKLELVVASNVSSATLSVGQDTIVEIGHEDAVAGALVALLWSGTDLSASMAPQW